MGEAPVCRLICRRNRADEAIRFSLQPAQYIKNGSNTLHNFLAAETVCEVKLY